MLVADRLRGRAGVEQRKRRLMRSSGLCEICQAKGKTALATVVDHIKPLALGGDDADENTRNLCDPCHKVATAEQFGYYKGVSADGWPI
ncbi:MAG: HNH endonuclease signature motif containing protein [Pseudomonadota bacterium]